MIHVHTWSQTLYIASEMKIIHMQIPRVPLKWEVFAAAEDTNFGLKTNHSHLTYSIAVSDLYSLFPFECCHSDIAISIHTLSITLY